MFKNHSYLTMPAFATLSLLLSAAPAMAAEPQNKAESAGAEQTAYVDSVHDWGLWEFGPSPAAGGAVHKPSAPNVRNPNVQFRPNDAAAFGPGAAAGSIIRPTPATDSAMPDFNTNGSGTLPPGMSTSNPNVR